MMLTDLQCVDLMICPGTPTKLIPNLLNRVEIRRQTTRQAKEGRQSYFWQETFVLSKQCVVLRYHAKSNTGTLITEKGYGMRTQDLINITTSIQGLVVQSIVSLTTSLRGLLVKYMWTTLSNMLLYFVGNMCESFAVQKILSFFQKKKCKRFSYFSNKK